MSEHPHRVDCCDDPTGRHVAFRGGPMDGYVMPVQGWPAESLAEGVAHISPLSAYGPGGRSIYEPPRGDPGATVWEWQGDCP